MRTFVVISFVLLVGFPAQAIFAQEITGDIEGRIRDNRGDPVAFANVVVSGPSLQGSRGVMSTTDGYFGVFRLPPGTYTVKVYHVSYQQMTIQNVVVRLGKTVTLGKIRVTPTVYEAPEIVVTERKLPIDVTVTELGGHITAKDLETLPTLRDYRSAVVYLPQANTSFLGDGTNVAGSTGSENAYYIQGVNVTDPYLAKTSTQLPQNFIKEIRLISGGYQAEYGRSHGGIIDVITQSGSNEFRGSGFAFFSNNTLTANTQRGPIELKLEDFARYDIGVSLSGPIAGDKLWYYAAYDPTVQFEDLEIPGVGFHRDELITHQFASKLTWQATKKTNLELVAFGDPSQNDRIGVDLFGLQPISLANADPFLSKWTTGGVTVALNGQHLFSDKFLLEGNVYRFDTREKVEPATETGRNEPLFTDWLTGEWSGGYQNVFDNHSVRWAGRVVGTGHLKNHRLKAGLEYEDNKLDTEWNWITPDGVPGWIERFPDSSFGTNTLLQDVELHVRVPSVFVQDSWRAAERLRLNAGVRWDGYYSYDSQGDLAEQINGQYQPRVGLVYQIGELGSQKIFGSYGRFYEQIPTRAGRFLSEFYQDFVTYTEDPRANPFALGDTQFVLTGRDEKAAKNLKGQHFDEFILGYERHIGETWKASISGIHREQREVVDDAWVPAGFFQRGNPGRGDLDFLPDPIRRYSALELTVGKAFVERYRLGASYVLSRSYGNYVGVFDTDSRNSIANAGPAFDFPAMLRNSEGRLPNDRPHVFKIYGSHATRWGLSAGGFFTWQSGTPLSEFGLLQGFWLVHQRPRGTFGRTSSIWDLNLRFSYDLASRASGERRSTPRLLVDIFHLFSQKEPVAFDQVRYFKVDDQGNPVPLSGENPFFMQPIAWQPPMVVRVGIETGF
ncbi:MAG: TonB-dependent receptor [Candidatus Krumholzibacteria bacterium]